MKRPIVFVVLAVLSGCDAPQAAPGATAGAASPQGSAAQTGKGSDPIEAPPPTDPTNIVSIAAGSKDHTTLVAALKAANYVTSVASPGPFTVFAPTNAAFAKLPPGTVEGLVKPEKHDELRNILKYHVTTSALTAKDLRDGDTLGMANGAKVTVENKDGKIKINDANVIASIPGSNGIVHVIDTVLLPPAK